jgi:hypothetical protein
MNILAAICSSSAFSETISIRSVEAAGPSWQQAKNDTPDRQLHLVAAHLVGVPHTLEQM